MELTHVKNFCLARYYQIRNIHQNNFDVYESEQDPRNFEAHLSLEKSKNFTLNIFHCTGHAVENQWDVLLHKIKLRFDKQATPFSRHVQLNISK